MATGCVLVWNRSSRGPGRFYGFIADDAFGADRAPRDASVYFTERDVLDDPESICRQTRVEFDYKPSTTRDRKPEAANVRMLPLPVVTGTVDVVRPQRIGFFAFIRPDGDGVDAYFTNRMVVDPDSEIRAGSRVRYRHDDNGGKPRARNVEVIE